MKKIFIITSEESGANIAKILMQKLKLELNNNVIFYGIGNEEMLKEGLNLTTPMKKISVMGIIEVLRNIKDVVDTLFETEKKIREIQPDIVIGIDSQDFAKRIFNRIKNLDTIKIQYIAPSVWAWRSGRAKSLKGVIDYLFTLFPFENKFFENEGLKTFCVGHPIIENDLLFKQNIDEFYEKFNINKDNKIITLLPGSRISEITKHLGVMIKTAESLSLKKDNLTFFIPTTKITENYIKSKTKDLPLNIKPILIDNEKDKLSLFKASHLAIAASGTVSLELGISKTPTIIIYKVNKITAFIVKKMIKIKQIGLINILMNKEIYPELLQENATPCNIQNLAEKILYNESYLDNMKVLLTEFQGYIMQENQSIPPSEKAAKLIREILEEKQTPICDKDGG